MTRTRKFSPVHAIAAVILSVCTLPLLVGVAPSASAAAKTPGSGPTLVLTATKSTSKANLTSQGPETITCTAIARNPHDSKHVGGTVNFVGQLSCTYPVASLTMTLYLYWNGYLQNGATNSNKGQASLSNNVAAACTSGAWQGSTVGEVKFPPGYTPSGGVISQTNIQDISC